MRKTKCIIVHLTGKRKTLAFGSIAAIFHHLTPEDVGCGYDYLRRAGLSGGGTVVTKRAIIQQTTLLTAPRGGSDEGDSITDKIGIRTATERPYNDSYKGKPHDSHFVCSNR